MVPNTATPDLDVGLEAGKKYSRIAATDSL
jgi:hypothetical protein